MGVSPGTPQDCGTSLTDPHPQTTLSPPCSTVLAARARRVARSELDLEYRGLPSRTMPTQFAWAEIVDKLPSICWTRGGPASRNQRLVNGRPALRKSPTIMVGGRESYEARCRHCHKVPRADEDQTALL